MLITKNVVLTKVGNEFVVTPYDKVNFDFAASDAVEALEKTSSGEAVKINGAVWTGTAPKADYTTDQSDSAIETLVGEALQAIAAKFPVTVKVDGKDVPVSPYLTLLKFASNGMDLAVRASISQDVRPPKPIDPAKAKEDSIKSIMRLKSCTREKAEKLLALMDAE